jgi:site-specific recombinase XerD
MAQLIEACSKALTESYDSAETTPASGAISPQTTEAARHEISEAEAPRPQEMSGIGSIADATKAFLAACETNGVKPPTIQKYRNSLNHLAAFAADTGIQTLDGFKVTDLDAFRAKRGISPVTSQKELETSRQFWTNDVEPYTVAEVDRIIAATLEFGRTSYERKRALAMILTLRYTALRISDVAVLRHNRISRQNGRWVIFLRATKNNKPIFLPVPRQMKEALDDVPRPRGASEGCLFYFWAGTSEVKSIVGVVGECVSAAFRKSGVDKAHAHRFRHTLATELLGEGATYEEVADVLGDSVEVVKKHNAKWSPARQARLTDLMSRVHGGADWESAAAADPRS